MEGEIQSPQQRTPNKRNGGLEDSGFLSPGQLDQTPIPLLTRCGGVPQGRRALDVAPESPANSLEQDGESTEEEEEQLVQGIEPRVPCTRQSPAGPSRDKWAWTKGGRMRKALITVFVLLAISVAINCWQAVRVHNTSKDNNLKDHVVQETQGLQSCASLLPCPMDWIWTNGTCYFYSEEKKTWDESQKFCESHNGTLPILDQRFLDTIRRYKTIDDPWIGLRKINDSWQWLNGSPFSNSTLPLAQDGPGLHCAYLNEKEYGVLDCTTNRNFICTSWSSFSMAEIPALG
ncbi:NKG2-D type II integral membrane protein-like [Lissotriton helveticus]